MKIGLAGVSILYGCWNFASNFDRVTCQERSARRMRPRPRKRFAINFTVEVDCGAFFLKHFSIRHWWLYFGLSSSRTCSDSIFVIPCGQNERGLSDCCGSPLERGQLAAEAQWGQFVLENSFGTIMSSTSARAFKKHAHFPASSPISSGWREGSRKMFRVGWG